ncbi:hypothetical protein BT69DRAFT_639707 [Atractiella rhizophila]|nr:hypothetical protein BT69DRAFT_639707 [Atractiella rhizophila]
MERAITCFLHWLHAFDVLGRCPRTHQLPPFRQQMPLQTKARRVAVTWAADAPLHQGSFAHPVRREGSPGASLALVRCQCARPSLSCDDAAPEKL